MKISTVIEQVNSRDVKSPNGDHRDIEYRRYDHELIASLIKRLEESPEPIPMQTLLGQRKTVMQSLQVADPRVFECDNGAIGLTDRHDGGEIGHWAYASHFRREKRDPFARKTRLT